MNLNFDFTPEIRKKLETVENYLSPPLITYEEVDGVTFYIDTLRQMGLNVDDNAFWENFGIDNREYFETNYIRLSQHIRMLLISYINGFIISWGIARNLYITNLKHQSEIFSVIEEFYEPLQLLIENQRVLINNINTPKLARSQTTVLLDNIDKIIAKFKELKQKYGNGGCKSGDSDNTDS